jgi:hypothetical protein
MMNRRLLGGSLVGLVLALTLGRASAHVSYLNAQNQPQKWSLLVPHAGVSNNVVNPTTKAVRYFLPAAAYSAANKTNELNAARACFDQWQAVPGSILKFEEGGVMSGELDVNTNDGTNVIFWAKNSTIVNGGMDNISGTTGLTFSDFFSDSTLAEADIVLNGVEFSWFTDFNDANNAGQFVESVLLHEIGHFVGLAHSPVGSSTMFPRGGNGVSVQAGLSPDEVAAVHALYPNASTPSTVGRIVGQVTMRGLSVLGAGVYAEDAAGNIVTGTVTRGDGVFDMPGLPPGTYQVRAVPLDATSAFFLMRGADVAPAYASAETGFLPTTNTTVTVRAGAMSSVNFAVTPGTPGFRIGRLLPSTTDPGIYVVVNYATAIPDGASNFTVGVYSTDPVPSDVTLRLTGDGLTFGQTTVIPNAFPGVNPPLNLVAVPVQIALTATPGMRSLIVQNGTTLAYANGYVEIPTPFPDYNFDGLDDRFQRQYFPRWTAPEAAPNANPDGDRDTNAEEFLAGSNPTDPHSLLRVDSIRWDAQGATITWPSASGRHYIVQSRPTVTSSRGWQAVSPRITAAGEQTQWLDNSATPGLQFYRVEAVP